MVQQQQSSVRNRLLKAVTPGDFALLQPHLRLVQAPLRLSMISPGVVIERMYFPERGFTSVTHGSDGQAVEIGMIGREGLVGAVPVLLGVDRSPYSFFVQMAGSNLEIDTVDLLRCVDQSATLRSLFLRYIQTVIVQTAQTAFANAGFDIKVRLARWLLMCHDRSDGDDGMDLTHEFLSMMLGVRRAGVTVAIQILEGGGYIKAIRGNIRVIDREGLKGVADISYGLAEAEYASLISM